MRQVRHVAPACEPEPIVSAEQPDHKPRYGSLGESARAAVLWGAGFTLVRDVLQFATMLVLVRLLTPAEYGSMALAQAIFGLLSAVSFKLFASHAIQLRDPTTIDWHAHFTWGAAINTTLFIATLGVAGCLSMTSHFRGAALPLAVQALVFLVEVPASLRTSMLESSHNWPRYRALLFIGALLATTSGIFIALAGGGVLALAIQPILFILPAALDLWFITKWRPAWTWSRERYDNAFQFGLNRALPTTLFYGRNAIEHSLLATSLGLVGLGVYSRSIGLATLIAGRTGSAVASALHSVLTRSPVGSSQFQRHVGLILQAVVWITVPTAGLLALSATDTVLILYGKRWIEVAPLLPLAATAVGLVGINYPAYSALLANEQQRACLHLEIIATVVGVTLAWFAVAHGARAFLYAMISHGLFMLILLQLRLLIGGAITTRSLADTFLPAGLSCIGGLVVARLVIERGPEYEVDWYYLTTCSLTFATVYIAILRFFFTRQLTSLLAVAPGGRHFRQLLAL